MNEEKRRIARASLLVQRLARISADSIWAHRASGVRASLDKFLSREDDPDYDQEQLEELVQKGFEILEKAAEEITSPESFFDSQK